MTTTPENSPSPTMSQGEAAFASRLAQMTGESAWLPMTPRLIRALAEAATFGGGFEWQELVPPGKSNSFYNRVKPLIRRGYVQQVREAKYIPETETWVPKLFLVTADGLAALKDLLPQCPTSTRAPRSQHDRKDRQHNHETGTQG